MGKAEKPLGGKAYGSIPHLPGSRLGPGDYHCHEGQARICCEKARDKHDRVIVTEKLDGACVSIARIGDDFVPLIRAGFPASTSPRPFLQAFATWVDQINPSFLSRVLDDGDRICGEWLIHTHGTLYAYRKPFVAFDIIRQKKRIPFDEFKYRTRWITNVNNIAEIAHVVSDGPPTSIDDALQYLGEFGFHGALEKPEGLVWRVERNGEFDFNAKFVRHDKVDGKYWGDSDG